MDTPEQSAAITAPIDRPVAVIACPGSGKTRTIVRRAQYVLERGFRQSDLLIITFTRKAARELRERIGTAPSGGSASLLTLHAFGLSILRRFGNLIGLERFRIASEAEQTAVLSQVCGCSAGKDILLQLHSYKAHGECDDSLRPLFERYNDHLRSEHICDYSDLILLPCELAKRNAEVRDYYRRRFRYVMIDEMQDVSTSQFELIRTLFGDTGRITVVGDDDQAIYGWRGANPRLLLDFPKYFPDAAVFRLTKCFRCPPHIVKSMSSVIQNNQTRVKKEITSTDSGSTAKKIRIYGANSPEDEAALVLKEIERVGARGSIAVLYRTRKSAAAVRALLTERNIQTTVSDKARFLESSDVNTILNHLQLCSGLPYNSAYVDRAAAASVAQRLASAGDISQLPIRDAVSLVADALHLRSEPVSALLRCAGDARGSLSDFLYSVRTESAQETGARGVHLSTVHQAKGLEWDHVFVVGACEGQWPPRGACDASLEEERRLFYVAMSRARRELAISYIKSRGASPFVAEIPELYAKAKVRRECGAAVRRAAAGAAPGFCSALQIAQRGG